MQAPVETIQRMVANGGKFQILYRDVRGNITDRVVDVMWAETEIFGGLCMVRNADRCFRYDRVEDIEPFTGYTLESLAGTDMLR